MTNNTEGTCDVLRGKKSSSVIDYVAKVISSGFFVGYIPVASGTFGSLWVVVLYFLFPDFFSFSGICVLWIVLFFLGVWAASRSELFWGNDPGKVVIDEIVGMFVTIGFLSLNFKIVWLGFFLFRILDIVKPPPARWLEKFPGGWGIMADDVLAGVYANIVLQVLIRTVPWIL